MTLMPPVMPPAARAWLDEMAEIDASVHTAVAQADTPRLDRAMRTASTAANYSRLWIAEAVLLSVLFGPRGRRAGVTGLAAIGLSSATVNLVVKPLAGRARPERPDDRGRTTPHIRMPGSRSFPSGHAASAVAFASGAARVLPHAGIPLRTMAALVAYSRVHTGVHYPADVVAGAVIGSACADVAASVVARRPA